MNSLRRKNSILLVEDDRNAREGIARFLRGKYDITVAEDGVRGLNILKKNGFDLVVTDIKMPGVDGMEILAATKQLKPSPPCVLITAYGTIEAAVKAIKDGAYDFVSKPINLDQLELILERAFESINLREENELLRQKLEERNFGFEKIIGKSGRMADVMELVRQVAPAKSTVLITGESGTGKELIAQAVHMLSGRKGQFVPVHCAALSSNLLESELFGHEKGAFTGAAEQRKGRFESADNGTIFLDEIGEIDLTVQVKLLRVLESRSFERVGGSVSLQTSARVITATNRDLEAMVARGEFREDLFFRLNVINIELPSLRERPEDIPLLIKYYLEHFAVENGKKISGLDDAALDILMSYDWPGNVRELRNCLERMVVLSRGDILQASGIPKQIRDKVCPAPEGGLTALDTLNIEKNERRLIVQALDDTEGNRTLAAEKLGISRRTLHRKLIEYGIS